MHLGRLFLRSAVCTGTALCLAILLAWGPSTRWSLSCYLGQPDLDISIASGTVRIGTGLQNVLSVGSRPAIRPPIVIWLTDRNREEVWPYGRSNWLWPSIKTKPLGAQLGIPFLNLLIVIAAPTALLWHLGRRKQILFPARAHGPPDDGPAGADIGAVLSRQPARRALAGLVAIIAVGSHILAAPSWPLGAAVIALACLALLAIARWDRQALGLRLTPAQPIGYWVWVTVMLGVLVAVSCGLALNLAWILDWPVCPIQRFRSPTDFWPWLVQACVIAPALEETIYRFILCVAAAAWLGKRGAILVSGVAFAALHIAHGAAGPDNLIAGFILAWAFFKSRSIVVPLCLHALGNLFVGLSLVAGCYVYCM